jgi:4-amino-4-deoxy-L-arabinose transferase-like glycosyltransferase
VTSPVATFTGESLLDRKSTRWAVAGLMVLLFCLTNLPWQLDDYDQAKQAFTSFEMVNEGHWFYQHTPNERIATKPPLVGWLSAGLYGVTRSWELSWRIPSLAAALTLLLLLARQASRAYGVAAGMLAMSAFGLNLLSPRLATLVRTDMPLTVIIFLLGLTIWNRVRSGGSWQAGQRFLFFALLSTAMLIKGPILYAFLLPGIAVFQWRRRTVGGVSAWCGWWPWIASLAIFLGWVAGGIMTAPGFYEQVVLREFAGRFGGTVHRSQPLYFYLPHLLHKFAPWSVLLLALAVISWRAEKRPWLERCRRLSPDVAWLLCWSLGGFVVMSLIPSKRVDRIFPVIPPLCLLLAASLSSAWSNDKLRENARRWAAAALLFAVVFATGYSVQRVVRSYRSGDAALVDFGAAVRREAAAGDWRYDVVGEKDEGLLLYLRRTHFVNTADAVARWDRGAIDALVVPADEAPRFLQELAGSRRAETGTTVARTGKTSGYALLTRQR